MAAAANQGWHAHRRPNEIPNVLIHFDHQVQLLALQIVNASYGQPVHPVFSNFLERN